MTKRCDLHVHTLYSYDVTDIKATFENYCLKAIEEKIDVICFTDHIEANDLYNSFDGFPFEKRIKEFNKIKEKYKDKVKILLGYEVGEPHLHKEVVKKLRDLQADMIIGSIHYPIDAEYFGRINDKKQAEKMYSQMVLDMIENGDFDVVGHIDYFKKMHVGSYKSDDESLKKIAQAAIRKNKPLELNTSSLRVCSETMANIDTIRYYASIGGKYVCVNSDSHTPKTLGAFYYETKQQLPEGIKLCYFEKGKLIEC